MTPRIPHTAAPGSEAEARAIRAIEAYYEHHMKDTDSMGHDLYRQCAESIVESGEAAQVDTDDLKALIKLLDTALRGNKSATWLGIGDAVVDLACVLGIVPSFDEWGQP